MLFVYNTLLVLLLPFWFPWAWLRAKRRKEQPNWQERQGDFDLPQKGNRRRIWIHAVSVGEFVSVKPVLRELRTALPKHEIVVSVTTSSGHRTAREAEPGLFDHLVYFPLDLARFQLAAMQRVQPEVVAIVDTELWLNFLWAAKVFDARTMLINGRISDRSFPRSKRIAFYYRAVFERLDRCLMQTRIDADRATALGSKTAEAFGNCKFDQAIEGADADPAHLRQELGLAADRPVLVVGSTRGAEEETIVIEAIRKIGLDFVQVVHAPRHLERVPDLARAVSAAFGSVALRSQSETGPYLILDTYGELSQIYSVADIVVIGGGFLDLGGQNILQPLGHGKPVIHGPHMQNFRDVAAMAAAEGATLVAENSDDIAIQIRALLDDSDLRIRMGEAASRLISENLGVSRRYAAEIASEAKVAHKMETERKNRLSAKAAKRAAK